MSFVYLVLLVLVRILILKKLLVEREYVWREFFLIFGLNVLFRGIRVFTVAFFDILIGMRDFENWGELLLIFSILILIWKSCRCLVGRVIILNLME